MIDLVISKIKNELTIVFDELSHWFSVNDDELNYQPKDKGWSIRKVLEHISLTNHFLLILIKKGAVKAIARAEGVDFTQQLLGYDVEWDKLKAIGEHQSFKWNRPEHMEPSGLAELDEIKNKLQQQLSECLSYLDQLKKGEGILYKTAMSVNGLGKIDVYHYILFLARHVKRHLAQMEKIKAEFEQIKTSA